MTAPVSLRPISEADLEPMARFSLEPEALGEFEWSGFTNPEIRRRHWEEDGLLGDDYGWFAVVLPDGTFTGMVSWRNIAAGSPGPAPRRPSTVPVLRIGILLLPEHRGKGYGTAAQRLLVEYLFATMSARRIEAGTAAENIAEQRALEKVGFVREGVVRSAGYRNGRWVDGVTYSILRDEVPDPPPA